MSVEFESKKEAREYKRHVRAFAILSRLVDPIVKKLFAYEYDSLNEIEGPYLLVSNHTTDIDAVFIGLATKKQLYFVASDHVTRGGLGSKLLMRYFKPIIHTKGKAGTKSLIEMRKMLKRGVSVCLFPEGNRCFNGITGSMPDVTGKVAKKSGAKLVTYRLEGGYFSQPRWGTTFRKGKIHGSLMKVYDVEDLQKMSADEINLAIKEDLYEDAFARQREWHIPYKGKKLAYGMESTLFMCPKCKQIGKLYSDENQMICNCGNVAIYTEYGQLVDADGKSWTITEWDEWQKQELKSALEEYCKESEQSEDASFVEDQVTLRKIDDEHKVIEEIAGTIYLAKNGIHFKHDEQDDLWNVRGLGLCGRNTIELHLGEEEVHCELKGDVTFSGLKYKYIYNYLSCQGMVI